MFFANTGKREGRNFLFAYNQCVSVRVVCVRVIMGRKAEALSRNITAFSRKHRACFLFLVDFRSSGRNCTKLPRIQGLLPHFHFARLPICLLSVLSFSTLPARLCQNHSHRLFRQREYFKHYYFILLGVYSKI